MLLGLDIGTGSAKAVLLDDNGNTVAEAGAAYSVDAPHPGWGCSLRTGCASSSRGR
jgi:xylulokinase